MTRTSPHKKETPPWQEVFPFYVVIAEIHCGLKFQLARKFFLKNGRIESDTSGGMTRTSPHKKETPPKAPNPKTQCKSTRRGPCRSCGRWDVRRKRRRTSQRSRCSAWC